jgi:hypothetical protein
MPLYRVYRLSEARRNQFRWAPHISGEAGVKPTDYNEEGTVEASSSYAAWSRLKDAGRPLGVGDILEEVPEGELRICKYVGFEPARWVLPEIQTGLGNLPVAGGGPQSAADPLG